MILKLRKMKMKKSAKPSVRKVGVRRVSRSTPIKVPKVTDTVVTPDTYTSSTDISFRD